MMATFDYRRSDHQRSRDDSICLSEIDDFLCSQEPFLPQDMHMDIFDNILENEDFKSAFGSIVDNGIFEDTEREDEVDVVTIHAEPVESSSSCEGSISPEPVDQPTSDSRSPLLEVPLFSDSESASNQKLKEKSSRKSSKSSERSKSKKHKKSKKSRREEKDRKSEKSPKSSSKPEPSPTKSIHHKSAKSGEAVIWFGAHKTSEKEAKPEKSSKSKKRDSKSVERIEKSTPQKAKSLVVEQKPIEPKYKIPKLQSNQTNRRQTILLPVVPNPVANRKIVSLDHDYCLKDPSLVGVEDDFNVMPMDLEPEEEKAMARIEVLPDLSLAARDKGSSIVATSSRSLLKINQKPRIENAFSQDDDLMVQIEEVVATIEVQSDDVVRRDAGKVGDRRSRKRYQSESSSDGSAFTESDSECSENRRKRKSRQKFRRYRNDRSRSRSRATSKGSYFSDRSRSRSRCSSPDYNRRSYRPEDHPLRSGVLTRPRRNIWCTETAPQMPPLNRPGGKKTAMQEALDKIRRGESRKVIYVGRIPEGTSRIQLREWFSRFGEIAEVSLHFRETGENYGFVTYLNAEDAYEAVEHGNDDPSMPKFQLCFGGRRQFCGQQWQDLDSQMEKDYMKQNANDLDKNSNDFDSLLHSLKKFRR